MLKVDEFALHDEHRQTKVEHRQWMEDIARWREEHSRVATMLEAVKAAWAESQSALEDHARQVEDLQEHSGRHEEMLYHEGWGVDIFEDESRVSDHERFQVAHAEARQSHDRIEQLYLAVAAEVLELLKLTHPDAVVLETN